MPLKTLASQYPKAYAYLASRKRQLARRKQYAAWYSFSAPRNLVAHETSEILIPLLANRGLACEIADGHASFCLMASGGFSITVSNTFKTDPHYILALLNSELLFWYLSGISNKFRGGWITCTKQYVGRLPIRKINQEVASERILYENIVATAKAITKKHRDLQSMKADSEIERTKRRIAQLETKLNDLVFNLYGCQRPSETSSRWLLKRRAIATSRRLRSRLLSQIQGSPSATFHRPA